MKEWVGNIMNWICFLPMIISAYHRRTINKETIDCCPPNKRKVQHYSQKELKQIYNEYKKGKNYGL